MRASGNGDRQDAGPTGTDASSRLDAPTLTADAGARDSGSRDTGGADLGTPAASCSVKRSASVSDACWSCLYGACPTELAACGDNCWRAADCARRNMCLATTNPIEEILCLVVNCTGDEAVDGPTGTLDLCLIGRREGNELRRCESVCGYRMTP